jgi:hypothetical protein
MYLWANPPYSIPHLVYRPTIRNEHRARIAGVEGDNPIRYSFDCGGFNRSGSRRGTSGNCSSSSPKYWIEACDCESAGSSACYCGSSEGNVKGRF